MATYSSILAWRIPWTEKPGGLQSKGSQRVRQDWGRVYTHTHTHTHTHLASSSSPDVWSKQGLNLSIFPFMRKSNHSEIRTLLPRLCCGSWEERHSSKASVLWGSAFFMVQLSHPYRFFHKVKVKVAQLCPTLCNPMDYTGHEILEARILDWVAIPFSRGFSPPRDWTQVSHIAGRFFTSWATSEAQCWILYCYFFNGIITC